MVTVVIFAVGVLFILNGITSMMNYKVLADVRAQMPNGCEIYSGTARGLLFITSYDAFIAVKGNGIIQKAFCVKRGWMRKSKSVELSFKNCSMDKLNQSVEDLTPMEQRACAIALFNYNRRRRRNKA